MPGITLGFLKYVLGFDSLGFKKGMSEAERELAVFGKKMQKTAATMAKVGAGMTIAITAPMIAFSKGAFDAATNAAELQSSFDTTFGKMSASMNAWAETTGDAMGRSTQEMQKAANTFGIFFNQAVDPAKAAAMSRQFSTLAQDLGSFFNTDTETAIEKLRAGLSGEAEPLRAFGVFLNEAAVKAKALELGLTGVGGKLTDQEKIQARAAIILEQTAKAQGDVARTSGGTANQIRAAKAAFEELQVTVGTRLLPVITPLITKIADALNWFSKLPEPVKNTALAVAGVSAVLGPSLIGFAQLLNLVSKIGPAVSLLMKAWTGLKVALLAARVAALTTLPALIPFLVPLAAIAAAVGAVYLAWKNWDKIKAIAAATYTAVKTWLVDKFNTVVQSIKAKIDAVIGFFRNLWDKVVGHSYIPDMVAAIGRNFDQLQGLMVAPARRATQLTGEAFKKLKDDVGQLLDQLFPDEAEARQQAESLALLARAYDNGAVAFHKYADARARVAGQSGALPVDVPALPPIEDLPIPAMDPGALDAAIAKLPEIKAATQSWGEALKNLGQMGKAALGQIIDGSVDILLQSKSLGDAWKNLGRLFHNVAEQILADMLKLAIRQGIMALFGGSTVPVDGTRALGGPVTGGKAYLVGEKGPEIFMPARSGAIIPNKSLSRVAAANDGAPVVTLSIVNDFRRADPAAVAAIRQDLDRMKRELPGHVVAAYSDARARFVIRR